MPKNMDGDISDQTMELLDLVLDSSILNPRLVSALTMIPDWGLGMLKTRIIGKM
jgi:hypothetical protein